LKEFDAQLRQLALEQPQHSAADNLSVIGEDDGSDDEVAADGTLLASAPPRPLSVSSHSFIHSGYFYIASFQVT